LVYLIEDDCLVLVKHGRERSSEDLGYICLKSIFFVEQPLGKEG
jgi:hypothetical protein